MDQAVPLPTLPRLLSHLTRSPARADRVPALPAVAVQGRVWPEEGLSVAEPRAEGQMQPQASFASQCEDISVPLASSRQIFASPWHLLPTILNPGKGCVCPGKGWLPNPRAKQGHCPGAERKAVCQALCPLCPEPFRKHSPALSLSALRGTGGLLSPHCLTGMDSWSLGWAHTPVPPHPLPADTAPFPHAPSALRRPPIKGKGKSRRRHRHLRHCALPTK